MHRTFLTITETALVLDLPEDAVARLLRDGTLLAQPRLGHTLRIATGHLADLVPPQRLAILDALVGGRFVLARLHPQANRRDPIGRWIGKRCTPSETSLSFDVLVTDHARWCSDRGLSPAGPRVISQRLTLAGYRVESFSRKVSCHGIELADAPTHRASLTVREVAALFGDLVPDELASACATRVDDLRAALPDARRILLELLLDRRLAVPAQPPGDGIEAFLGERCERVADGDTPAQWLYDAYLQWCAMRPEIRPRGANYFGMRLDELGFASRRAGGAEPRRRRLGLALQAYRPPTKRTSGAACSSAPTSTSAPRQPSPSAPL